MSSRRPFAASLSLLLLITACSPADEAASTTLTPVVSTTSTTAPAPEVEYPSFDDDGEEIEVDPDVRIGVLDNGLTYYIRENDSPGGRAQLRLAVKAGSVQETDRQRGVAHFLEHMAFNGTERFPANELVLILQRFGAEFGPEINAYVNYQETVYELQLPTDDPDIVESGLDVLFEWSSAIALDPAEVELERGVLVEEWRVRDQDFWGRYFAGVTEILLSGTDFEGHRPLADPDEVAATTPGDLTDFYETWYRPDTMAVVAVGDFDADEIEELIRERFSELESPDDAPPVPAPTTSAAREPTFFILPDPEYPQAWSELNYPLPAVGDPATVGAVRRAMAFDLAWEVIVGRLEEQSLRGDVAFFDPSFAANPLVRSQRSPGLAALAEPQDLAAATESLLTEVQRALQHGFGPNEFERFTGEFRSAIELEFDERATTQDAEYADRYVEHFLGSAPIPSAESWHELRLRLLDEITPDIAWRAFAAAVGQTEPFVILVSPAAAEDDLPTEADLMELVSSTAAGETDPWPDAQDVPDALMEAPDPVDVIDRGLFSDTGLTELTLANGVRVVFLPTTIRDDVVVVRGSSPGGWSLVAPDDAAEAQLASSIAVTSGVGSLDQVDLERYLADRSVSVSPFIDEVHEGFFAQSATDDIETLLQLIHLYMTEPRFDARARDVVVAETLPFSTDVAQVPELAVRTALADERFDGDVRFRPLPPAEDLESLDLVRAEEIFEDRFDDPGDFVFAFIGDFDEDAVEELARRYLGSIEGPGSLEPFTDVRPDPPAGIVERTIEAGTGVLGGVTFLFSSPGDIDATRRIEVDLLELIVQQRLTERIREQLSASYSPFASTTLVEDGEESIEFQIQISGDPAGLDEVVDATLAEIEDLRVNGPTDDELAIASEQLRRDYELISNEFLGEAIVFSAHHPDENLSQITDRIAQTGDPTHAAIQALAAQVLAEDRYIVIRLVPEGFAG